MRISGNFSTPNFNRLYIKGDALDSIARYSEDEKTKGEFEENMASLKGHGNFRDILVKGYGKDSKGIQVQIINPKTLEVQRNIAHNKDFMQGLKDAVKRLDKGTYVICLYSTKRTAEKQISSDGPPVIIDAEELNKLDKLDLLA